jgi:putative endonuclease
MRRPGVRIPLPPVFARSVVESEGCRAVALAKADLFHVATSTQRATTRHAMDKMGTFTYVYILQSEIDSRRFYTGCTRDLRKRLARHNRGEVPHTSKCEALAYQKLHRFLGQRTCEGFRTLLKFASGRAFVRKRL